MTDSNGGGLCETVRRHYRYDPRQALAALEAAVGGEATAQQLAELAGVSRRTIVRWRTGESRSILGHRIADRIEAETGVHISRLEFTREEAA